MRGVVLAIAIIVIIGLIGTFVILLADSDDNNSVSNKITTSAPGPVETHIVEVTENGFSPSSLTISVGDSVNFVNKNTNPSWPASDVHPTHQSYPESGIEKCGTAEEESTFDACKGLGLDESYSFTFENVGVWTYHDHLMPSRKGSIVVG